MGQELDELTVGNFTGSNVADLSYAPETGMLSGKVTTASGSIRIADDDTTIATLHVVIQEDDVNPIDTGN